MDLKYEEIKEGRKVVAVKFIFNRTKILKVTNQRTGVEKNLYVKPKKQNKKVEILDGQMCFNEIEKGPQSIKNTLSKIFDKFKS
jgi:hypothetical protein